MSEPMSTSSQSIIVGTSIATFFTGFLLGIYSIRGYLISPDLADERKHNLYDPLESEESDIDEDDTVLDHAPNWSNGADADRRQGLSASAKSRPVKEPLVASPETNEECKLVLVVRTDLGMTKGMLSPPYHHFPPTKLTPFPPNRQNSSPMLPRNPRLLQISPPRRPKKGRDLPRSQDPPSMGTSRPSQDRRPS